jgi:hypothetical protein
MLGVELDTTRWNQPFYSIDGGLNWQPSNTFELDDLGGMLLDVLVRDSAGTCVSAYQDSVVIGNPVLPVINEMIAQSPTDCGLEDGSFTLSLEDTNQFYQIQLGDTLMTGNGTFQVDSLATGSYDLTITDSSGMCTLYFPDTVQVNAPFIAVFDSIIGYQGVDCDSTDARIVIAPSSPDLEYSFDGGASWSPTFDSTGLENRLYNLGIRSAQYQACATYSELDLTIGYSATVDWEIDWSNAEECLPNALRELTLTSSTGNRLYFI